MKVGAIKKIIIGAVVTIIGIVIFVFCTSSNNRVRTKGIISEIESTEYRNSEGETTTNVKTYVKYEVDGKTYESTLSWGWPLLFEGTEITIYYYKAFPKFVTTRLFDLFLLIIPLIGIVIAVKGIIRLNEINDKPEISHL